MKKEGAVIKMLGIIVISLVLMTTLTTLVSSEGGFFKSLKSWLTGKATSQTFNLNISVGNNPPNITALYITTTYSPLEAATRNVTFYFTANDTDGYQNINLTSARANFTFYNSTTSIVRTNNSCVSLGNIDAKTINFSCTIALWYFDPQSTAWQVTAYAEDSSGASGQNNTINITYQSLQAFAMGPAALTFNSIANGATNQTSTNDPLILNNTGNFYFDLTTGNISVNASDLAGESTGSYRLYAQNFTIGNTTGGSPPIECGTASNSFFMNNETYRNITSAKLPFGNLSAGGGAAQSNLYVCLTFAGNELTSQAYSTGGPNSRGAWTVKVG